MNANKNILITSAGRRVELVQAFQRALNKNFPEAKVFTTDLYPELSAACQISSQSFQAPKVSSPEYVDFLLKLCTLNNVGLIIPTIDTELQILADNRLRFEERGVYIIVSDADLIEVCRDKRKTAETYASLKISQPAIFDKSNVTFPCFCKPYDGSCSVGAFPLLTQEMLTDELLMDEKNMFMELVGKEYSEYTIDVYYDRNGKLCCLLPRERIEVRGGEVSKGATRKNYVYEYLRFRLEGLKGARGCITAQVFANPDNESIKALEINPRFGGGFPLSYAAGADYADWLIREYFCDEEISFFDEWEDNLIMLRYDAKVLVHAD
jgi:carbamoyl-phosphate synthase large subunit